MDDDEQMQDRIEPLDDWVHVQPSVQEEKKGRIYLPADVRGNRLQRVVVLACGSAVVDVAPGDVVLVQNTNAIDLRDGSQLVQRPSVVARLPI